MSDVASISEDARFGRVFRVTGVRAACIRLKSSHLRACAPRSIPALSNNVPGCTLTTRARVSEGIIARDRWFQKAVWMEACRLSAPGCCLDSFAWFISSITRRTQVSLRREPPVLVRLIYVFGICRPTSDYLVAKVTHVDFQMKMEDMHLSGPDNTKLEVKLRFV